MCLLSPVDILATVTLRNLSLCCPPDLKLNTAVNLGRCAMLPRVATARSKKKEYAVASPPIVIGSNVASQYLIVSCRASYYEISLISSKNISNGLGLDWSGTSTKVSA